MKIHVWLKSFKEYWQTHNVNGVLSLFDKNVIYFETPFLKLDSFSKLEKVWENIKNQNDISLYFEIFSSHQNKHSVIWKLKYNDKENIEQNYSGTYLIELNNEGLCTYFHHCCESV